MVGGCNLALVSGTSQSGLNPRLRRIALKLSGRVEGIEYIPGESMGNAGPEKDGDRRVDLKPGGCGARTMAGSQELTGSKELN